MKILFLTLLLYLNITAQWYSVKNPSLPSMWSSVNSIDVCDSSTAIIHLKGDLPRPFYITTDKGETWKLISSPESPDANIVTLTNENNIWFCTDVKIFNSTDSGINWSLQYLDSSKTSFFDYIKMFDMDNGVAVGDAPNSKTPALILKTNNGGKNWVAVNDSFLIGAYSRDQFYPIDFPDFNTGYFFDTWTSKLFKTINGGRNWASIKYPTKNIYMLKFYDNNIGIIITDNWPSTDRLFRTTDGGINWKELSIQSKSSHHDLEFLSGYPSRLWFTDFDKLFFSSDTGTTWTESKLVNGSLGGRNIKFTDSNNGWLLCDNGKIFRTNNNGGVATNIQQNKDENIHYSISQNYPNPFNPTTKIEYQIPAPGFVELKVYNVLGREVATLVNEEKPAGFYQIEFNASSRSAGFSSGIYFYELRAGSFRSVKKMILIK
ncbi:MAG: T9SS type A sorting domain-containing protein [Ignavibacteriales bacterium]|nr:T9SS type A sorting domain-containing protein [Ignavibacteriales bacterium]